MKQDFENVKVGDTVVFYMGGIYSATIIDKVTRVTPKQFEVRSYRFRKKDGSMVGDVYRHCRLATEKDIEDFKMEQHRNSLRNKICKFFKSYQNIDSLTTEEMEKINAIISKPQQ